jgi:predicted site-specific integrase-resolvase
MSAKFPPLEVPIFPADLMRLLGISHANTLRRYIKDGKVPEPDKKISQKTRYWHRSTLERAGLITPVAGA